VAVKKVVVIKGDGVGRSHPQAVRIIKSMTDELSIPAHMGMECNAIYGWYYRPRPWIS
jgi:hypothetical protein